MKIKDCCKVIVPMRDKPKNFSGNIPWCRIDDIDGKFLNGSKNNLYVDQNTVEKMHLHVLPAGTVICAVTGASIGTYAITTTPLITNQTFAGIVCGDSTYNEYLYYFLKLYTKVLINLSVGCAQAYLTRESIENIDIGDLSFDQQVQKAKILKNIDEKIVYNNAISSQLESLAKTIYDYWFLQFDFPDENGNPYRSSGGKMVWNDELKKEIPEGWEVKHIKNCIQHINTGLNPRNNFVLGNGNIKYITVKNLTPEGNIDWKSCDTINESAKKIIHRRSDVSKGDILFASIAPLGRCVLVEENPKDWDINESVFSVRPNYDLVSSEYLYLYFMSEYFIKKAEHSSTGSVFSGIRISVLENMPILVPSLKVAKKFEEKVKVLLYKKYNNEIENNSLASLRDFLLPLLMNGQVTVK